MRERHQQHRRRQQQQPPLHLHPPPARIHEHTNRRTASTAEQLRMRCCISTMCDGRGRRARGGGGPPRERVFWGESEPTPPVSWLVSRGHSRGRGGVFPGGAPPPPRRPDRERPHPDSPALSDL